MSEVIVAFSGGTVGFFLGIAAIVAYASFREYRAERRKEMEERLLAISQKRSWDQ